MNASRSAEIGVVFIHGMGDPEPSFADSLIDGLTRSLGKDAGAVAFESCFWSDILQSGQEKIWERLQRSPTPMHFSWLRHWIVGTLGDPTGYLSGYEQQGIPVLRRVHERFAASLAAVEARLRDPLGAPLVVLAHSLGGVVVTNYLWNLERAAGEVGTNAASALHEGAREVARRPTGETRTQRLETLAGLITFGCNIPLFLPPQPPYECVRFPRPGLPERLRSAAKWLNVYDPYDILGYPLAHLWDDAHGTVIEDIVIRVGIPGISMTPFSHTQYWNDAGFQALVAEQLRSMLRAARS